MTQTCPTPLEGGRRRGVACGRAVRGFVAPGQGRCGYHLTTMERARTLAVLHAIRDTRELRACPREPEERGDDDEQPQSDEPTDSERDFDPVTWMDTALDEL